MSFRPLVCRWAALSCLALAWTASAALAQDVTQEIELEIKEERPANAAHPIRTFQFVGERPTAVKDVLFSVAGQTHSDYWIGVSCHPADEVIRLHLQLENGLVVDHVASDGPADKAGVKTYDILLAYGDQPLQTVNDLITAGERRHDQPTPLRLLRAGKEIKLDVTATKRPDQRMKFFFQGADVESQDLPGRARIVIERLGLGEGQLEKDHTVRARVFGPGMVLPEFKAATLAMPADLKVQIQKQGDAPARIVVTQRDQQWEVTQEHLEKLPEDIRPHVQRMLGQPFVVKLPAGDMQWFSKAQPDVVAAPQIHLRAATAPASNVERQLESLHEKLDRIQTELGELRSQIRPKARKKSTADQSADK